MAGGRGNECLRRPRPSSPNHHRPTTGMRRAKLLKSSPLSRLGRRILAAFAGCRRLRGPLGAHHMRNRPAFTCGRSGFRSVERCSCPHSAPPPVRLAPSNHSNQTGHPAIMAPLTFVNPLSCQDRHCRVAICGWQPLLSAPRAGCNPGLRWSCHCVHEALCSPARRKWRF